MGVGSPSIKRSMIADTVNVRVGVKKIAGLTFDAARGIGASNIQANKERLALKATL